MRKTKSKKLIAEVAKAYVDELTKKFPGVETEIISPGIEGHDVWIRVEFPEGLAELEDMIGDETVELNFRWFDETGVTTVATVVPQASR